MLTLEQCREFLGDDFTDKEVIEIRDGLYVWLNQVLDSYLSGQLPTDKL